MPSRDERRNVSEMPASIVDSDPLSEADRAELDRRLASHAANPDAGASWEVVKARLRR